MRDVDPEDKPENEPMPDHQQAKKPNVTPLQATLILARRGNKKVLPQLRRALDEHPELWKHYGSLTLQAQEKLDQSYRGEGPSAV